MEPTQNFKQNPTFQVPGPKHAKIGRNIGLGILRAVGWRGGKLVFWVVVSLTPLYHPTTGFAKNGPVTPALRRTVADNPKLYKAEPKRELSAEGRIVVEMGGTGSGVNSFLCMKACEHCPAWVIRNMFDHV